MITRRVEILIRIRDVSAHIESIVGSNTSILQAPSDLLRLYSVCRAIITTNRRYWSSVNKRVSVDKTQGWQSFAQPIWHSSMWLANFAVFYE